MASSNITASGLQTLKEIHLLLAKELQISQLQTIPPETYQRVSTSLGILRSQKYDGMESIIGEKMIETITLAARLLLDIRYQKTANGSTEDYSKLTNEEKYILDGNRDQIKRRKSVISAITNGRTKVLESISDRVLSKQITIRFVKSIEQFMGVDMSKYGPFKEEDVAILPFENALSLIENGEAVEIESI